MNFFDEEDRIYIEQEMHYWDVPGFAVAVIKDDQVVMQSGFGYRNREKKLPVTPDTQFGIASNSKSFTSALLAMLVDEGKLDWDEPIRDYLPDFKLYDPAASSLCTVRDLLCHRTGLANHDAMWPDAVSREEFFHRLRYLKPNLSFREKLQYNNTLYVAAGHIAERLTGQTWEDLVRTRLFEPLGMSHSTCSLEEMKQSSDYAVPYQFKGNDSERIKMWNVDLAGPAASINSSVSDMIRWLNFHIHRGIRNGQRLISEKNMDEMHRPHLAYSDPLTDYGLGWAIESYRGFTIQRHSGAIEGYCAMESFIQNQGLGIMLLMNQHTPSGAIMKSILYHLIDRVLGLPKTDWPGKFHTRDIDRSMIVNLLPNAPVKGTFPSHLLTAYEGIYHHPGYGDVQIRMENSHLQAIYKKDVYLLEHYHYDTFKISNVKEDTYTFILPLTFITDPYTGAIKRLDLPLEPKVDAIAFCKKS